MTQEHQIGCMACKHNNFDGGCAAFSAEIPFYFASGQGHHTKRMPDQDNDIVFEWIDSPRETLRERVEQRARMKRILAVRKAQKQVAV
jgi:hypothetical protein